MGGDVTGVFRGNLSSFLYLFLMPVCCPSGPFVTRGWPFGAEQGPFSPGGRLVLNGACLLPGGPFSVFAYASVYVHESVYEYIYAHVHVHVHVNAHVTSCRAVANQNRFIWVQK